MLHLRFGFFVLAGSIALLTSAACNSAGVAAQPPTARAVAAPAAGSSGGFRWYSGTWLVPKGTGEFAATLPCPKKGSTYVVSGGYALSRITSVKVSGPTKGDDGWTVQVAEDSSSSAHLTVHALCKTP